MQGTGIIIGGGIAGLTTALAMQRIGIQVKIYESAPQILPLGAGIWMAPNAMQVFHRLGIAAKINEGGVPLHKIQVADKNFRPLMRTNQDNIRSRFGYTTTAIKRSKLQEILLNEVGLANVFLSKTCIDLKEKNGTVTVCFSDGSSVIADFVIAADGIHSMIRDMLFPGVRLSETGYIVWRGISEIQLRPEFKKAIIEVWHNGLRFGFSEVADGVVDWFAVEKANTSEKNTNGIRVGLLHTFSGFSGPVQHILSVAHETGIIKNILTDFNPLKNWHKGRICLIGDAAHAATPYMGQGGCQAVEDAYVISKCLHTSPTPEKAFAAFQKTRRSKAVKIVKTSRIMGKVGYMHHAAGKIRNFIIRATPLSVIEKQFISVYSLNY